MTELAMTATDLFELQLEHVHHVLLNHDALLIEILDDEVMLLAIDVDNDRLDSRLALDEHTWVVLKSTKSVPSARLTVTHSFACPGWVRPTSNCARHLCTSGWLGTTK